MHQGRGVNCLLLEQFLHPRAPTLSLSCPGALAAVDLRRASSAPDFAVPSLDLHLLPEGILLPEAVCAMDAGNSLSFKSRTNSFFV